MLSLRSPKLLNPWRLLSMQTEILWQYRLIILTSLKLSNVELSLGWLSYLLLYSLFHKCLIFYLPLKCDSFLVFYYQLFSSHYSHPSWVIPSMPLDSTTMILFSILSMIMSTIPTSPDLFLELPITYQTCLQNCN